MPTFRVRTTPRRAWLWRQTAILADSRGLGPGFNRATFPRERSQVPADFPSLSALLGSIFFARWLADRFKSRRKNGGGGGVRILGTIDNRQLIDSIRRQKHQKLQIRRSEVHGAAGDCSGVENPGIHSCPFHLFHHVILRNSLIRLCGGV